MTELEFREMFPQLDELDDKNFDLFATQFTDSLEPNASDPPYWHGRLIGYGAQGVPYRIRLMDQELTEEEFRNKLGKEIVVKKFDLVDKVLYDPDTDAPPTALEPHTVEYVATLTAVVNGKDIDQQVRVTHRIRKCFVAYETEISFL